MSIKPIRQPARRRTGRRAVAGDRERGRDRLAATAEPVSWPRAHGADARAAPALAGEPDRGAQPGVHARRRPRPGGGLHRRARRRAARRPAADHAGTRARGERRGRRPADAGRSQADRSSRGGRTGGVCRGRRRGTAGAARARRAGRASSARDRHAAARRSDRGAIRHRAAGGRPGSPADRCRSIRFRPDRSVRSLPVRGVDRGGARQLRRLADGGWRSTALVRVARRVAGAAARYGPAEECAGARHLRCGSGARPWRGAAVGTVGRTHRADWRGRRSGGRHSSTAPPWSVKAAARAVRGSR